MPLVSGQSGTLTYNSVAYNVTDFTLSTKAELTKFGSSTSGGWKTGVPGTKDGSGTATIRCQENPPAPGAVASMVLSHGDFDGTGNRTYTFDAVITDRTITVNVDTGEAIAATLTFEAIGVITEASPA